MPEVNFNLLNPGAELYSGPQVTLDPVKAYETAQAKQQSNMLAQLYAKHYDPQTGGVNYNSLIGEAAQSGLGKYIPDIMGDAQKQSQSMAEIAQKRALQQQEETAAEQNKAQTKGIYDEQRHKEVNRAVADVAKYANKADAMSGIEQKFEEGKIDQQAYNNLMNMVRSEPSWARSQSKILQSLLSEKEQLEVQKEESTRTAPKPTQIDVGGSIKFIDMNPNSATYKQEIKSLTKTATPAQVEKTEKAATLTPTQQAKLKASKAEDISNYNVTRDTATDLVNLVDSLLGNKAKGMPEHPGLGAVTGYASLLPLDKIPKSDASAAQNIIDTISGKVNVIGRNLAQVSGKLGNMAVQEWEKVAASVQKLNPKAKNFPDQLRSVVETANRLEKNMKAKYKFEYDEDIPGAAGGDGDWSDL